MDLNIPKYVSNRRPFIETCSINMVFINLENPETIRWDIFGKGGHRKMMKIRVIES